MVEEPKRAPRKFSDVYIRNLRAGQKTYEITDLAARGLRVAVWPSGKKSFIVRHRRPDGTSAKLTLGWIPLAAARKAAAEVFDELRHGRDPSLAKRQARAKAAAANLNTVAFVCNEYLKREGVKLRTHDQRKASLERLVYPVIGKLPIGSVTKLECVRLFDKIADQHGPVQADHIRAILSKIFGWHQGRSDFISPITRFIPRHAKPARERARTRILTDDEIRRLWTATETTAPFPALIRFLLFTGCRLNEAAKLPRKEIVSDNGNGNGNVSWLLPAQRNKTKLELLRPLSPQAVAILTNLPVAVGCNYYFTADGRRPLSGFSKAKKRLEQDAGLANFRLHDIRRTSRSLLARAGVFPHIAERCLGHVTGLIESTYDHHSYESEMRRAFERLAAQIEFITSQPEQPQQPASNIVALRG
jgi:integrase